MRDKSKLVPPGCRSASVVNPAFLFGELERGSQEPDLFSPVGDGTGSSKHSLNPRFSLALMRRPIAQAYGFPVDAPFAEGKAIEAINDEARF